MKSNIVKISGSADFPNLLGKEFFARSGVKPDSVHYEYSIITFEHRFTVTFWLGDQRLFLNCSVDDKIVSSLSVEFLVMTIVEKMYPLYLKELDRLADEFMGGR